MRRVQSYSDYSREQAFKFRERAGRAKVPFVRQMSLEFAAMCEEPADNNDDRRVSSKSENNSGHEL